MPSMDRDDVLAHCLAKPGAWQDEPWEGDLVTKVGDKIFAFHGSGDGGDGVGVKCGRDRDEADEWLHRYPDDASVIGLHRPLRMEHAEGRRRDPRRRDPRRDRRLVRRGRVAPAAREAPGVNHRDAAARLLTGVTSTTSEPTDRPRTPSSRRSSRARGTALLRTCVRADRDRGHAEDLLQSALTKTYLAWGRIRDRKPPRRTSAGRSSTTAVSMWRRPSWRRERTVDQVPTVSVTDPTRGRRRPRRDLAGGRHALPPPARSDHAALLRRPHRARDRAHCSGCSVGAVKSHGHRAITALRARLGATAIEPATTHRGCPMTDDFEDRVGLALQARIRDDRGTRRPGPPGARPGRTARHRRRVAAGALAVATAGVVAVVAVQALPTEIDSQPVITHRSSRRPLSRPIRPPDQPHRVDPRGRARRLAGHPAGRVIRPAAVHDPDRAGRRVDPGAAAAPD